MEELDYKALGKRVKIARIQHDMTQDDIADITLLSNSHISNIETASTKVGLPTLLKIANAIGVTMDELLCDSLKVEKQTYVNEITKETNDCSEIEIRVIADTIKSLKASMRNRIK